MSETKTPNFTVAMEVAELHAHGTYPTNHARIRMRELGMDEETIEVMLEKAKLNTMVHNSNRDLVTACRTLIIAWDTLSEKHQPECLKPAMACVRRETGELPR